MISHCNCFLFLFQVSIRNSDVIILADKSPHSGNWCLFIFCPRYYKTFIINFWMVFIYFYTICIQFFSSYPSLQKPCLYRKIMFPSRIEVLLMAIVQNFVQLMYEYVEYTCITYTKVSQVPEYILLFNVYRMYISMEVYFFFSKCN